MRATWYLVRKNLSESRWMLGVSAAALFGLSWLFVFMTVRVLEQMMKYPFPREGLRVIMEMQGLEGLEPTGSVLLFSVFWNHVLVLLLLTLWGISRGSFAVSGELERGTLDLQLTRPVTRGTYLASHTIAAVVGLLVLAGALVAGTSLGLRLNKLENPPSFLMLVKPALNYASLGLALFGISLLASSVDHVRWRPTLIASCFAVGSIIMYVVAHQQGMEPWKWIDQFSIYRAYRPGNVAFKGSDFLHDVGILLGVAAAGLVGAYLSFRSRDLPANS